MRIRLIAPLLLFTLSSALGAFAPDRWLQLRSEHFIVLTNSDAHDAIRIASQFERMRSVFATLIPTAKSDNVMPITVIALKDKKSFEALEPAAAQGKGKLTLAGVFLRTPDRNYILVRLDDSDLQEHPFATVYHEYTHLLNSKFEALPLWLNEGLAEFYQNTDINQNDVRLGQPSSYDISYLNTHPLIPLATLLAVDHNSPYYHDEQKGSVFYAESWALTHLLIIDDRVNHTHLLSTYLINILHGEDSVTAAQHAWGDLKKMDQTLDNYVHQNSYNLFQLPMAFKVDTAAFKIEPVSTADANAVRADVLVYEDRQSEALTLLDSTLHDDPNNALAHETMGFLKFREHDMPAARKWYDEAVQLGSQSYLAFYYAAVLDLNADPARAESNLRSAIKLNPAFAPSYDALAHLIEMRHEDLSEAHRLNSQAIQYDPGNIYYRLNAASVLLEQQQPQNALNVLKAAEKIAKTPTEIAMVAARRQQLETLLAQSQQAQTPPNAVSSSVGTAAEPSPSADPQPHAIALSLSQDNADPHYAADPATGPQHVIKGLIHDVKCYYPSVLAFTLTQSGKALPLYTPNYFKVTFQSALSNPGDLHPCTDIEGRQATITYAELTRNPNPQLAVGQILKVELSK